MLSCSINNNNNNISCSSILQKCENGDFTYIILILPLCNAATKKFNLYDWHHPRFYAVHLVNYIILYFCILHLLCVFSRWLSKYNIRIPFYWAARDNVKPAKNRCEKREREREKTHRHRQWQRLLWEARWQNIKYLKSDDFYVHVKEAHVSCVCIILQSTVDYSKLTELLLKNFELLSSLI